MKYSEKFNQLAPEIRKIGCAMEAQLRVQHLKLEKARLEKRHKQSIAEINAHIKNCEQTLKKLEEELRTK